MIEAVSTDVVHAEPVAQAIIAAVRKMIDWGRTTKDEDVACTENGVNDKKSGLLSVSPKIGGDVEQFRRTLPGFEILTRSYSHLKCA